MSELTRDRIEHLTRIPRVRRKKRRLPRFLPVIFGNGEDDDTPGMEACANNRAFQMDAQIYEANEDVVIVGKRLVLYRQVRFPVTPRFITIQNCFIEYRE